MALFVAWLVFPVVLGLISLGCGLLLEKVAGLELPAALLLPLGFVVFSLATQFAHMSDATAELATPLAVVVALVGFGLSLPGSLRRVDGWLVTTGAAVYAVFAAPTVLTGRATFLGYIKLDDTATYLAMLDRAGHHGYDATGLGPSTYEALLESAYVIGYPLGAVLPLDTGRALVSEDLAWLWQPYVAFLALLIGLSLYQLVTEVVGSRPLRAIVAVVGAQAALVYGYGLWGGVKELFTAATVSTLAALVPITLRQTRLRAVLPIAAASAAVLSALSLGGAVWLALPLAAATILLTRQGGVRRTVRTALAFVAATALLCVPALSIAGEWLSHSGDFTSSGEYGNLIQRLSRLQVFGIWPNGDFRTSPSSLGPTYVLAALVGVGALLAVVAAWRLRAWSLPIALGSAGLACLVYVEEGSPWIAGKALASASPIVLAAGLAGAAIAFERGRRTEAAIAAAAVIAGVLWSNVLQYHDVWVAPSGRLSELEYIGQRFAGQGPTLLTEFEPYGARHFLRTMDTEGASELRRNTIPLRTGKPPDTGASPDLDEIQLDAVLHYPTLVVRRSGVASRPPSDYTLVSGGSNYQVWQRPEGPSRILEHLSLGSRLQPAVVPSCSEVLRLGRLAEANGGVLAAVERPPAIVIGADGTIGAPESFGQYGEYNDALYSPGSSVNAGFSVPSTRSYGIWVGGSFRTRVRVSIDGLPAGSARNALQWPGNFVQVGDEQLGAGPHTFRVEYGGSDLRPGSGGTPPFGLGPFAVAQGTQDRQVTYVEPSSARSLCGKSLDWVEALRG
jgi:hypothetical protein